MEIGKLTNETLENKIFSHLNKRRQDILLRPQIGEDCSAIDFGEYACILSTDPITGTEASVGSLAVHVASNDIATAGVAPIGLMMTLLAPPTVTLEMIEQIIKDANEAAGTYGIEIIGGHTEVTSAVNQVVVSMTAIGKQSKEKFLLTEKVSPGDEVIMTKTPGVEGTGIIAYEKADELKKVLTAKELNEAKSFLKRISVIPEGIIGGEIGVQAMHDITEGGLSGALWEMCEAAQVGCQISLSDVYIPKVTQEICDYFSIDPLKLISSGAMLMVVAPEKKDQLMKALETENIEHAWIGKILPKNEGRFYKKNSNIQRINPPKSDELYQVV